MAPSIFDSAGQTALEERPLLIDRGCSTTRVVSGSNCETAQVRTLSPINTMAEKIDNYDDLN
jgi:hypothetical protein